MDISAITRVCGIIGNPVAHSLSPVIQNAAFRHLDLGYIYAAFKIKKDDLEKAIQSIRVLGIHGMNVTMPHKEAVIEHLDKIEGTLGTVNTILNSNGDLIGYSTDGIGALEALRSKGIDPKGKRILILGAGGASRAIIHVLIQKTKKIVIMNRTIDRAKKIAFEIFESTNRILKVKHFSVQNLRNEIREADILINATSLGMHPNEKISPIKKNYLNSSMVVFDLIYNPIETRLLKEARSLGAVTVNGLSMLVHQGAASFELWTGKKAPLGIMMKSALQEIRRRGIRRS